MSQTTNANSVPWYLWPFWAVWRFLTWILNLTGRLLIIILGLALIIVGAVLIITVILAPLGIPIVIFGFLLILRGLF